MSPLAALIRRLPPDPRPDGALVAAFLADRDEAAFAELVRRHGPLVWAACRRRLPDPTDADDAFQATFLVLVRRAAGLTGAGDLGPWLYKVAALTAGKARRRNARRFARLAPLPADLPAPAPASPAGLDDALLRLPERYRATLVLCFLEGLTHREAAARLGCPAGTVSSLVARGLARLRSGLAGRDPTTLLAAAAAGSAPEPLAAATVRSAAALRLTSLSAAASPAVAGLTEGVLRMFWVKKATAAGLAAVVLLAAGVGVGVSVRQAPRAVAADPPKALENKPADPPVELSHLERRIRELEARQKQLAAQEHQLAAEREVLTAELAKARAVLEAQTTGLTSPRLSVSVGYGDETHPYSLSELTRDRKAGWSVSFYTPDGANPAPVREYLTRVMKERDAPKAVHVDVVMPAATLDQIKAALETCRAVGLTRVSIDVRVKKQAGRWEEALGLRGGHVVQQFPEVDLRTFDVNRFLEEVAVFRHKWGQPARGGS